MAVATSWTDANWAACMAERFAVEDLGVVNGVAQSIFGDRIDDPAFFSVRSEAMVLPADVDFVDEYVNQPNR